MIACEKAPEITPEIVCEKTEVVIPVQGTEEIDVFVEFNSNVEWTAAIKEKDTWCNITPKKGDPGDAKIKVLAEANPLKESRVVTLVITAETAVKEVSLVQSQLDAFELLESSAAFGPEGGNTTIKVNTNVAWDITIPSDCKWVKVVDSKAYGEQTKTLSVDPYDEYDTSREAKITVKGGNIEPLTYTITQDGPVTHFELVSNEAYIESEGGSFDITVNTNIEWTVTIPEDCDWIKPAGTKADGQQTKTFTVSPYKELDDYREAELLVKGGKLEPLTFTVGQGGIKATLWSVDMTTVLSRVGSYVNATSETVPTNVSMALFDGDVVVCAGDGNYPVILDKTTGQKKGELNTGDVKPGYITNDDAGNLVFCNRVWNYWVDYEFFTIYYIKPGTTTPVKLVSTHDETYYPSYIGGGLSVRGDVTKKAAIAAPWEGIEGVTGENMVLCWQVIDGKAQGYVKGTLTGFVGINWMQGYWCQSPNNFPGFALLSDSLTDGAVFACYDENTLYKVGSDFVCTKLMNDPIIDSNNTANAFDVRTINGKTYLAASGGCYFPQWCTPAMVICDASSMTVVANPTTHSFTTEEGVGASAAVRIEAAKGGLNVYHINNNCSVIEALWVPIE